MTEVRVNQRLSSQVSWNHSEEALLWLMEIQSDELNETLYVVNNNEDIVSRGITYKAFPFSIELPENDPVKAGNIKVVTYNVSEEFMDLVRQTLSPPRVKIELVSTLDLDDPDKTIDFMQLGGAEYDAVNLSFTLISSNFGARKTLQAMYTQDEFPALFFALQ